MTNLDKFIAEIRNNPRYARGLPIDLELLLEIVTVMKNALMAYQVLENGLVESLADLALKDADKICAHRICDTAQGDGDENR